MSKPDHPKKFPKIVSMADEVAIALRKFRGKRVDVQEIAEGIFVEFSPKGNVVGIRIKR